ncbi:MAG: hypothetical protein RR014_05090, partial [Bilophila sp.]
MLDALYRLYIDRFMEAVNRTLGEPKALTTVQKEDFYTAYARRFRGMSGALQGVAALPDFSQQMNDLKQAAQRVVDTNAVYSELVFAHDEARAQGKNTAALRQRMEAASQTYRQAVIAREQHREAFAQLVKKNPAARSLDDESLLYIASWIERRVRTHPDKMDATLQAATLFLDLAQHFEAANQALKNPPPPVPAVQGQTSTAAPAPAVSVTPAVPVAPSAM